MNIVTNKKLNFIKIALLAGSCLLLGWSTHHHTRHTAPVLEAFAPQERGIDIHVKALSEEESKRLIGCALLDKGIQPLQITIQNNTPYEYMISPEAVDIEHLDDKNVTSKVKKSMGPAAVGLKVLSVFFWPFAIPSTVDSLHRFQSNKALQKNLKEMAMKEEVVPTYATVNRIFFISKEHLREALTVTVSKGGKQIPIGCTISNLTETPAQAEKAT